MVAGHGDFLGENRLTVQPEIGLVLRQKHVARSSVAVIKQEGRFSDANEGKAGIANGCGGHGRKMQFACETAGGKARGKEYSGPTGLRVIPTAEERAQEVRSRAAANPYWRAALA